MITRYVGGSEKRRLPKEGEAAFSCVRIPLTKKKGDHPISGKEGAGFDEEGEG